MLEREADQLNKTLFQQPPSYDILIAVPTPDDADKFFDGQDDIGGMYQHGPRRLVARDIGGSLRHEFFHALHLRRHGAHSPAASFVDSGRPGVAVRGLRTRQRRHRSFLPNDRQIARQVPCRAGRLIKWKELFKMNARDVHGPVPSRTIRRCARSSSSSPTKANSRVVSHLREALGEDESGAKAFELVFGNPSLNRDIVARVDRDSRRST